MKKFIFFISIIAIIGFSANAQTAYIPNCGDGTVSVINVATNTIATTIAVGSQPNGVSVNPNGSKVYITNQNSNTVSVINSATNTVTATITVGSYPRGVVVCPDSSKVYVTNQLDNTVSVINTATNTVSATIAVGTYPHGITISPDGSKVYAANYNDNTVSVINSTTNIVSATITVGSYPMGISFSPDGSTVYVANTHANTVSVINTATNTVSATITVGTYPYGESVSTDGSKLYVTNVNANSVSVINTATNTVSATIAVGTYPEGISISPDGSEALVANEGSNSVSVINTATNTVSATITVGNGPNAFGNFISTHIYIPPPVVSISASANLICPGSSVILTASGATTYSWSNSLGTANPVTVMPTTNTTYSVTGTTIVGAGTASITINVASPAIPSICMVTTDSSSYYKYNVICWDKTSYNNVDSFFVYRKDVISSSYLRIGAVSANALSEFTDTTFSIGGPNGGNPRYSSWFYKLAIRDTCGNIGVESPYHQSMFVQESGSNFSWNAYTVEAGQTNPVTGYSFLRDDNNTGNWHVLANIAGLSTTDPDYSSYPNGNWRIDALGFNCEATKKLTNTQSFLKSHSNTIKPVPMGIQQRESNNQQITVYPNPANDEIQVIGEQLTINSIEIYNLLGEKVYQSLVTSHSLPGISPTTNIQMTNAPMTINVANLPSGVYVVEVKTEKEIEVRKFVKE